MTKDLQLLLGVSVLGGIVYWAYNERQKRRGESKSSFGGKKWNPQPKPSISTNWGEDTEKSAMPYGIPQDVNSFDTSDMSLVPKDLDFSGESGERSVFGRNAVEHYVTPLWTVG